MTEVAKKPCKSKQTSLGMLQKILFRENSRIAEGEIARGKAAEAALEKRRIETEEHFPRFRGSVVFMVGPTGSGKTTYRRRRFGLEPCISPDDFIVGKWTPGKTASAWAHARNTFIEILKANELRVILVDAQFVNADTRMEWVGIARGFGYETRALIFDTSFRQIQANQRKRGNRGGYGTLPYAVVLKQYRSFRDQLRDGSIKRDFHSVVTVPWKKLGGAR